jgi:hypothetical protein
MGLAQGTLHHQPTVRSNANDWLTSHKNELANGWFEVAGLPC